MWWSKNHDKISHKCTAADVEVCNMPIPILHPSCIEPLHLCNTITKGKEGMISFALPFCWLPFLTSSTRLTPTPFASFFECLSCLCLDRPSFATYHLFVCTIPLSTCLGSLQPSFRSICQELREDKQSQCHVVLLELQSRAQSRVYCCRC